MLKKLTDEGETIHSTYEMYRRAKRGKARMHSGNTPRGEPMHCRDDQLGQELTSNQIPACNIRDRTRNVLQMYKTFCETMYTTRTTIIDIMSLNLGGHFLMHVSHESRHKTVNKSWSTQRKD